jgi:hypothetical protein
MVAPSFRPVLPKPANGTMNPSNILEGTGKEGRARARTLDFTRFEPSPGAV